MTAKRVESWVVTDDFWTRVEPLIPNRTRPDDKGYVRKAGAGRPPKPARQVFEAVMYVLRTGCQWKALPKKRFGEHRAQAVPGMGEGWPVRSTLEGRACRVRPDGGNPWRWQSVDGAMFKRQWPRKRSGGTRPIGKNKCHLLVDGRGVPLSFIVTAANVNDITMLDAVLQAIAVTRQQPPHRRSKHLCADAGYRSRAGLETINAHGYIPHVVDRRQESQRKRRDPKKKAQRWVEVCHSWFNRFRKLLVRYEKLERSFVALNLLAAAIIAFRKVPADVNIIYG